MKPFTCKFYNGDFHNTHCEAGICYKDVTTNPDVQLGIAYRKPCIQWHNLPQFNLSESQKDEYSKRGTCSHYTEPTKEDIAAHDAEVDAMMKRFDTALPVIAKVKREHEGQSWKGVEPCPVCNGKLHLTHSGYNGHVWGKCETKDCLSWVE